MHTASTLVTTLVAISCLMQTPPEAIHSEGDASLKPAIDAEAREIYEKSGQPVFLLLRAAPVGLKGYRDLEVTGYYRDGVFKRIVLTAWDAHGKLGLEYYIRSNSVFYIYEDREFYEEAAPKGAWRNFKHIPAWERRIYLRNGDAGYIESTGLSEPYLTVAALSSIVSDVRRLLEGERVR